MMFVVVEVGCWCVLLVLMGVGFCRVVHFVGWGIACGAFGPKGPSHFSLLAQRKVTQRNGLKSWWAMQVTSLSDYALP
jgi:hypothetical protein